MVSIIKKVSPVQASVNALTLVDGSIIDTQNSFVLSYTIVNTGANSIDWEVHAGNVSDLSDGVAVKASAALAKDAVSSYSVNPSLYQYYGIYIKSTAGGSAGEATIVGIAKG